MSWFSFYQWIILFIIFTKNEIRCGRLHCSVNLFRHSFQYHKKITVVKEIFPNYPPSSSRPLTLTLPPEQHPIRPSSRRFIFDPLHFFNIVDRVPKISVRAFCPCWLGQWKHVPLPLDEMVLYLSGRKNHTTELKTCLWLCIFYDTCPNWRSTEFMPLSILLPELPTIDEFTQWRAQEFEERGRRSP